MKDKNTAFDTSLLPQYAISAAFMDRFLVAAHDENAPIGRSPDTKGFKLVESSELESDLLSYFLDQKEAFRNEFTEELRGKLTDSALNEFCDVLATEWIDGLKERKGGRCLRLKRSIYDFLCSASNGCSEFFPSAEILENVEPLISAQDIAAILTANNRMIIRHIEAWKQCHPNYEFISDSDIFIRRGLSVDIDFNKEFYSERDFLNSYSIAFSAPEKFSQIRKQNPTLVNGELALFEDRILFFSPFVPGMDPTQLEFGVIPSEKPLPLHFQGSHGGIDEYILDPAPFHK